MSDSHNNYGKPMGKRTCLPHGNWLLQLEGGGSQRRGRFPGSCLPLLLLQSGKLSGGQQLDIRAVLGISWHREGRKVQG